MGKGDEGMKDIEKAKLSGELDAKMGEKKERKRPAIHVEQNLPKGVESEWGRMLQRGKIKKQHIQF
jgi:hypothetical protein